MSAGGAERDASVPDADHRLAWCLIQSDRPTWNIIAKERNDALHGV